MRGIEPYNKIIVVFPSSVLPSLRFGNPPSPEGEGLIGCVPPMSFRALAEKSPAAETARYVPAPAKCPQGLPAAPAKCPQGLPAAPAHLPAEAHRREIPYSRNDDTRTRITDQANTLNATVIARSAATWQSPGREDLLAYTDKILAGGGLRCPTHHGPLLDNLPQGEAQKGCRSPQEYPKRKEEQWKSPKKSNKFV